MTEQQNISAEMLHIASAIDQLRSCAQQHGLLDAGYDPDWMDCLDGMILKLRGRNDALYRQQSIQSGTQKS